MSKVFLNRKFFLCITVQYRIHVIEDVAPDGEQEVLS